MVKTTLHEKMIIIALVLIAIVSMQGCSSNYQFGDVTKRVDNIGYNYCTATNPETRLMLKATLNSMGVNIGVDFCTAYGLKTIVLGGVND